MKNSKKSAVQRAKVFKQLNGEYSKISNDLNAKIAGNYLDQITNLFLIQIKKFGLRAGSLAKTLLIKYHLNRDIARAHYNVIFLKCYAKHRF